MWSLSITKERAVEEAKALQLRAPAEPLVPRRMTDRQVQEWCAHYERNEVITLHDMATATHSALLGLSHPLRLIPTDRMCAQVAQMTWPCVYVTLADYDLATVGTLWSWVDPDRASPHRIGRKGLDLDAHLYDRCIVMHADDFERVAKRPALTSEAARERITNQLAGAAQLKALAIWRNRVSDFHHAAQRAAYGKRRAEDE